MTRLRRQIIYWSIMAPAAAMALAVVFLFYRIDANNERYWKGLDAAARCRPFFQSAHGKSSPGRRG